MVLDEKNINEGEETSRNASQRIAMTAIYDALTYLSMGKAIDVESILSELSDCPYEEVDTYLKAVLIFSLKNLDQIKTAFEAHMKKWTFDRLNRVVQSILILSYVHYFNVEPDVDKGVVINIAVKLAKTYADEKDYRFVNAILDNVLIRPSISA